MQSATFNVQQLFQERRQYRVPFFQRPYVWNQEDQWGRLWEDIQDKAESRLVGEHSPNHFMGAVVLELKGGGLLGVERSHIIDGQQRLTTMQYVLKALAQALEVWQQNAFLPLVQSCLRNAHPETMEDPQVEGFKLWPTFRDRGHYVEVMSADTAASLRASYPESFTQSGSLRKHADHPPALAAVMFFLETMLKWPEEQPGETIDAIARALTTAILSDLSVVCISLGEDDDAQVIFETLNGHGAELHATDLIRNFIFMRAGREADELYATLWTQFESPLWAEPQLRGRLTRPRLEWFVQTVVQAETGQDIDVGRLYAGYRRYVDGTRGLNEARGQLLMLDRYAEHYRQLVLGLGDSPIGVFGRRLMAWDASPTHALALRVASSGLPLDAQTEIFDRIEAYLVRRAVCGLTRKNYNKLFAQQLRKLSGAELSVQAVGATLSEHDAEISRWPNDDEFRHHWITGDAYRRLDPPKLRYLFHRIETALRTERSEERVPLAMDALDIDHILPEAWSAHWALPDGSSVTSDEIEQGRAMRYLPQSSDERIAQIVRRESAVPTLGNLTMIHYGVNRSLKNHAFAEKRSALFQHSNLHLNRELMQLETWDEAAIEKRAGQLFSVAMMLWAGPAGAGPR